MLYFNFFGRALGQQKGKGVRKGIRFFIILLFWAVALFLILAVERKVLMDLLTWKSWAVN